MPDLAPGQPCGEHGRPSPGKIKIGSGWVSKHGSSITTPWASFWVIFTAIRAFLFFEWVLNVMACTLQWTSGPPKRCNAGDMVTTVRFKRD